MPHQTYLTRQTNTTHPSAMHSPLAQVRRILRDHGLLRPDARFVAAVSGGSDSVALLHALHVLDRTHELQLAGVVHFNHQLRAASDADEQFVRAAAAALGRAILVEQGDVGARAAHERRSIEDAARASRYECFARARAHFSAEYVAVGHTRDDQAETFLLRLVRGAGMRGLASMYPRNGAIVRPLLECRRAELRAWLADRGTRFLDDETNADVRIPRNRVRAELLPLLASRFNPSIVDALADEAELAREAWSTLDALANELERRSVKLTEDGRIVDLAALADAPPGLLRVVLWRAMRDTAAGRPIAFRHVAAALRLATGAGRASIDLPGQRLQRIGETVVLRGRPAGATGRTAVAGDAPANLFRYPLSIPGEVQLAEAGCVLTADTDALDRTGDPAAVTGRGAVAVVRGDLCRGTLAVRNRRPGDRFHPPGAAGRKKLQDYFVDRKVRRGDRSRVPLVVDEADRIVWVAGYGIDEAFQVTGPGQAVLTLRLRPTR